MSYCRALESAHSPTYRILGGADHATTSEACQQAYTSILVGWITEMVISHRMGGTGPNITNPEPG